MSYLQALIVGYLLGSIPFGLLLTRFAGTADIRGIGSGNIGATNVLRTGRRGLAAATLAGDVLAAGLGAFLGHLFPVWLGFKGGKGVATYIGILIGLALPIAVAFGAIWAAVAAITRYSSLSGLVASAATPLLLWLTGLPREALLFVVLTALLWFMHRANIARLIAGTEGKIGGKADVSRRA